MTVSYNNVTVSGYNSSPPPDDGSQTSSNEITWAGIKTKIGDPLYNAIVALDTAVAASFALAVTASDLGTASTYDVGTSGGTIPLLNGANTWSALQTFTANITLASTDPTISLNDGTRVWQIIADTSLGELTFGTSGGAFIEMTLTSGGGMVVGDGTDQGRGTITAENGFYLGTTRIDGQHKMDIYTSSDTWTRPSEYGDGELDVLVVVVGGGGGGGAVAVNGSDGGTSSFGSHATANGGEGGQVGESAGGTGGSGGTGDLSIPGGDGTAEWVALGATADFGGFGGAAAPFGSLTPAIDGATAGFGYGSGGGGGDRNSGGKEPGGGGGECIIHRVNGVGSSVSVTVGAGGAAGGASAGAGAGGIVIVVY